MNQKNQDIKGKFVYKNDISHVIIKYSDVISDPKQMPTGNRGRKFLVNKIYENKECRIKAGLDSIYPDFVVWKVDYQRKNPVFETGDGGIEVTTFTEKTEQDKHKHLIATEMYTVLEGKMKIKINEKEIEVSEKDEVIILPGTVQEILPEGCKFVTRGRSVNCYGDSDKYIEVDGEWKLTKDIK
jgi:mannose-6-phosphate isomerase-like protein (cupin superfamily)